MDPLRRPRGAATGGGRRRRPRAGRQGPRDRRLLVQQETIELWQDLNGLRPQRPMIQMDEVSWHELADGPDLQNRCTDPFARGLETTLRQTLYQWTYMRCDMVAEP